MAVELTPEIYRAVLDSLPIGIYLVDRNRRILSWNDEAAKLTGYLGQEVIGHCCWDGFLMHCDENNTVLCGEACPLSHTMNDGQPREADIFLRHKDGQRIPVRVKAAPLRNAKGAIVGALECFEERVLPPRADVPGHDEVGLSIDGVTEMPDHQSTLQCLEAAVKDLADTRIPFGVLAFAVDDLDVVRSRYGRRAVNAVLHVAARTLSKNLDSSDTLGRWSQDGFLAIVPGCDAATLVKSARMLKRLVEISGIPWWGDRLSVTLSVGGTMAREGDSPELLVARTEDALQASLREHGDDVVVA